MAAIQVTTVQRIKRKYASARDLRRTFGLWWAARVMPQILMQLMRNEDISITMWFYVGKEVEAMADVLWQVAASVTETGQSNKSGNKLSIRSPNLKKEKP